MEKEFNIHGDKIDTASVEAEISRRVEARKRSGVYSDEVEALLAERLPDEEAAFGALAPLPELDYAATRARSSWEVTAAYPVATDKRFLKPLVIFFKRLARLWARVAVGPIQREQTAFNRHVAQALDALRRGAIEERSRRLSAEEDLALLSLSLQADGEPEALAGAVRGALGGVKSMVVLGPCPPGLSEALESSGIEVTRVNRGTAWEGSSGEVGTGAPISFLGQMPEGSVEALLVPELTFWLRPEALLDLARRAYLVIAGGGKVAVAVHGFARSGPAPSWCSPEAVSSALELAGFSKASVADAGTGGGFVASANR